MNLIYGSAALIYLHGNVKKLPKSLTLALSCRAHGAVSSSALLGWRLAVEILNLDDSYFFWCSIASMAVFTAYNAWAAYRDEYIKPLRFHRSWMLTHGYTYEQRAAQEAHGDESGGSRHARALTRRHSTNLISKKNRHDNTAVFCARCGKPNHSGIILDPSSSQSVARIDHGVCECPILQLPSHEKDSK
jgi:hypothetical protein